MLEHNYKTYKENRCWSDLKIPEAIPIILSALGIADDGGWSWRLSSFFEDTRKGTDIVLIHNNDPDDVIMVAFRLRKPEYMNNKGYASQITVREAEYHKLMGGVADCGFYGFIDEREKIVRWIFINWNGFRAVHSANEESGLYLPDKDICWSKEKNPAEGDTYFRAYCTSSFLSRDESLIAVPEDKIIIARSAGWFEDISIAPTKFYPGVSPKLPVVTIKDKIDRIDGRI